MNTFLVLRLFTLFLLLVQLKIVSLLVNENWNVLYLLDNYDNLSIMTILTLNKTIIMIKVEKQQRH